jgi:hypothetical protein
MVDSLSGSLLVSFKAPTTDCRVVAVEQDVSGTSLAEISIEALC